MKPDIWSYTNYRDYLRDWFAWQKQRDPAFSYRRFAEGVPTVSYNYLQRVIAGSRALSVKYLADFSRVMEHSARQADFFMLLVTYDQCRESKEKSLILKQILIFRSREGKGTIREERLRFFENWYRPILRELVSLPGERSFAEIGRSCLPPLSAREVREGVAFLLEHRFLERCDGGYRQISPTITTGDEIASQLVRDYHAESLRVTSELIHTVDPAQREVSSLTFSVSQSTFEKMKEEIRLFRKRLIALAEEDSTPERVYQASFQLLPRSLSPELPDA